MESEEKKNFVMINGKPLCTNQDVHYIPEEIDYLPPEEEAKLQSICLFCSRCIYVENGCKTCGIDMYVKRKEARIKKDKEKVNG